MGQSKKGYTGKISEKILECGADASSQQMRVSSGGHGYKGPLVGTKAGFSLRKGPSQQHHKGANGPGQERGGQTRRGRDHGGSRGGLGARWRNLDFALSTTARQDRFEMGSDTKDAF